MVFYTSAMEKGCGKENAKTVRKAGCFLHGFIFGKSRHGQAHHRAFRRSFETVYSSFMHFLAMSVIMRVFRGEVCRLIELRHVTKRYGAVNALCDVSFVAPQGQIIGLLGQNGAGKTTTLNLMTGYLPPSEGQVLVDGMDMLTQARACKRLIGYLPEKPPLYEEMTVRAYLRFVCELKEVQKKAIAPHVEEIMATCGLMEVAHRLIGHLSKGYQQRVGIAQALCGNPRVLVLDEPTVGLDPRQVVEIRQLIAELGKTHTVIFSSHLLSEVQQLCQRVLILSHGHLEYEADMQQLSQAGEILRLQAKIAMEERQLLPALRSLSCVRRVKTLPCAEKGMTRVLLECDANSQPNPQQKLFRLLCGLDAAIMELIPEKDSLEAVFLRTTDEKNQTEKTGE